MTKILLIICVVILCVIPIRSDDFLEDFFKELTKYSTVRDIETNLYISNPTSTLDVGYDSLDYKKFSELEDFINKQKIPEEAKSSFRLGIFSEKSRYLIFSLEIKKNIALGIYTEFIGAAKNINGKYEIAFINAYSKANLVSKYSIIKVEKCQTIFFFFKTCDTDEKKIQRGLTVNEILRVSQELKAFSLLQINDELEKLKKQNPRVRHILEEVVKARGQNSLKLSSISTEKKNENNMIAKLQSSIEKTEKLLETLAIPSSLNNLQLNPNMIRFENNNVELFSKVIEKSLIDLKKLMQTKDYNDLIFFLQLNPNIQAQEWKLYQILFNVKDSYYCNYATVALRLSIEEGKFSLISLISGKEIYCGIDNLFAVYSSEGYNGNVFSNSEIEILRKSEEVSNEKVKELINVMKKYSVIDLKKNL